MQQQQDFSARKHDSPAILPLPKEVVAQIKSSTTVTSLNGVIFGLLENSLDARATKITISVDFLRGGCTIEDNGLGIPPAAFSEDGGLGCMYHTSKQNQHEIHGGQGVFLASVAALSLLSITSHHYQHYSHNLLTLHRAKPISRHTPAPPQNEIRNASHGTRIVVRDLFGNMPVRVKQRALAMEEASEVDKQWQALKKGITAFLLSWNDRIVITISDAEYPRRTFNINTSANHAPSALSERNLNTLNQKTSVPDRETVLSILTEAGYAAADTKDQWITASASTSSVSVKGIICLQPAPSRTAQFVSIGISPCMNENRHNELYDTINRVFSLSSFGKVDDDSDPDEKELKRRKHDRRFKNDGPTNRELRVGKKGVDRWPQFYFRIEIQQSEKTRATDGLSDMRLKSITNVLETLSTHWLEAHHFRPMKGVRKRKRAEDQSYKAQDQDSLNFISSNLRVENAGPSNYLLSEPDHPTERMTDQTNSLSNEKGDPGTAYQGADLSREAKLTFTNWSRIKSARSQMYEEIWKCKTPTARQTQVDGQENVDNTKSTSYPGIIVETVPAGRFGMEPGPEANVPAILSHKYTMDEIPNTQDDGTETSLSWINPSTKEKHRINARTGMVMLDNDRPRSTNSPMTSRSAVALDSRMSLFERPLGLRGRKNASNNATTESSWLPDFLRIWKNPVFANPSDGTIPTAVSINQTQEMCVSSNLERHCIAMEPFVQAGRPDSSRLSKTALSHAQVVSQVDQKFILLKMPSTDVRSTRLDSGRTLLVLVDQHAASERQILETLLQELCTPLPNDSQIRSKLGLTSPIATVALEVPLQIEVPASEQNMFKSHAAHFANWGILYNLSIAPSGFTRLTVIALPPAISERCSSEPKLIMELLRGEIYTLAEMSSSRHDALAVESALQKEDHVWLRRLGSCPKGLLQLLNSRACRSAIMFNDRLTAKECQNLIDGLKSCAFPFMCAHGRNSMVPLIYLEGVEDTAEFGTFGQERNGKEDEGFGNKYKQWREKVTRQ